MSSDSRFRILALVFFFVALTAGSARAQDEDVDESFFDSFLNDLLSDPSDLSYTAVRKDGSILNKGELADIVDVMREKFVKPFARLVRHPLFNQAPRRTKIAHASRAMKRNAEVLAPFFELIQRSQEDILAELLAAENRNVRRAFQRNAGILAHEDINIVIDAARIKRLSDKRVERKRAEREKQREENRNNRNRNRNRNRNNNNNN